jgi:hypothetical protein
MAHGTVPGRARVVAKCVAFATLLCGRPRYHSTLRLNHSGKNVF